MARSEDRVATRSAFTYTGTSLGLTLAFFIASGLVGSYPLAARTGGAIWVFILSMIVTMPLITSYFKKKVQG
ncbi:MAG: hypothetical protein HYY65_14075 [Candidatus Tectomicrobia bacterium]|uniref:Uncharacterized protein n=1 Tax=Tectimicrobiota bacterium TaxID=2528274 RepID=A0A932GRP3_UNCTE|nr:hypothetical protein [Candidatus Tectomicrobia bacterium]